MKVAYICRSFAPLNNIASLRHTKLVKYLARKGWSLTVFAEEIDINDVVDPALYCEEFKQVQFIRWPKTRLKVKRSPSLSVRSNGYKASTAHNPIRNFIRGSWACVQDLCLDLIFFLQFKKRLERDPSLRDFDLIFSSYSPMGAHWAADYLKRTKAKNAVWISDFRDLINDRKAFPSFLQPFRAGLQAWVCNRSDAVTTVSNGLRERLAAQPWVRKAPEKFFTLTNGYDLEDFNKIDLMDIEKRRLYIAYTGTIVPDLQDATLLFDVIGELIQEQVIRPDSVRLKYAGKQEHFAILHQQARRFGVGDIIENHGYVKRSRALAIQKSCDILLLLSWNSTKEQGILTGKFLEYIGIHKPILALITGDAKNSEITEILIRYHIGSSYYYLEKDRAKKALKAQLVDYYQQKEKSNCINFSPDSSGIRDFSYNNIAERLIGIVEHLRSKNRPY